jgi:hypothetical protein
MNRSLGTFMAAIPFALSFASVAEAQPQTQADKIPVKLQFVISTFEGDKKVSSMPYTILATANGEQVTLLSGRNIPIQTGENTSYIGIGTTFVCTVTTEAGNFKLAINFDEKLLVAARKPEAATGLTTNAPESPSFRDVNYVGTIYIKAGETKQLISSPDRFTGEVTKVDVTLTLDPPKRASVELDNRDVRAVIAIPISMN